jgi:hypothetical protein
MANFTHTLGITYRDDAGTLASTTKAYTADDESNFNETIAALASNVVYGWTLKKDALVAVGIFASAAMTVTTNSGADDTITLAAGQLIVWTNDSGIASPFATADVTEIKVSSTAGGLLKIRALLDVAP